MRKSESPKTREKFEKLAKSEKSEYWEVRKPEEGRGDGDIDKVAKIEKFENPGELEKFGKLGTLASLGD